MRLSSLSPPPTSLLCALALFAAPVLAQTAPQPQPEGVRANYAPPVAQGAPLSAAASSASSSPQRIANLTFFASLDFGWQYFNDGALASGTRTQRVSSGSLSDNRFGVKAKTPLAALPGWDAGLHLELGFDPTSSNTSNSTSSSGSNSSTGTAGGGIATERRMVASLSNGAHSVLVGRDYSPVYANFAAYDPFQGKTLGSFSAIATPPALQNMARQQINASGLSVSSANLSAAEANDPSARYERVSNSLGYLYSGEGAAQGMNLHLLFAPSQQNGANTNLNRLLRAVDGDGALYAARLNYITGPLGAGIAYSANTYALGNDERWHMGVSYLYGSTTFFFAWEEWNSSNASAAWDANSGTLIVSGKRSYSATLAGIAMGVGDGLLKASLASGGAHTRWPLSDNSGYGADLFALGYEKYFSTAATLYFTLSWLSNTDQGDMNLGVSHTSRSQSGLETGFRVRF